MAKVYFVLYMLGLLLYVSLFMVLINGLQVSMDAYDALMITEIIFLQ